MCVGVLTKLMARLTSADRQDPSIIEHQFKELCLETKKAENRFVSELILKFLSKTKIFLNFSIIVLLCRWT